MNRQIVFLLMIAYIAQNNGMENTNKDNKKKYTVTHFCCGNCDDNDDNNNNVDVFDNLTEDQISLTPNKNFGKNYLKISFQDNKHLKSMGSKISLHFEDKDAQPLNNAFRKFKDDENFIESGTKLNNIKKTIFNTYKNEEMNFSFCIVPVNETNYQTINIYLSCEGSKKKFYLNKIQDTQLDNNNNPPTTENSSSMTSSKIDTESTTSIVTLINQKGVEKHYKKGYFTIIFPEVQGITSIKNKIHIYIVNTDNNPVNEAFTNYGGTYKIKNGDKISLIKKSFLNSNSLNDRSVSLKCIQAFDGRIYFKVEGDETELELPN